jgi:hypothetical protein
VSKDGGIYVNGKRAIKNNLMKNSGGYRWVAETKDGLIVKLDRKPSKNEYHRQTYAEIRLYDNLVERDKKYFPEIIAHGRVKIGTRYYSWLIEKKLELPHYPKITKSAKAITDRLVTKYGIQDMPWRVVGDCISPTSNWTIINRRPVIFDFGFNMYGV